MAEPVAEGFDYLFKILIVGETGVGKSCILLRYADNFFSHNYISTIGVDFKIKKVNIDDKSLKLQIWDTAGQERYRTIVSSFYRGAHGILLVFDVTDPNSFLNCKHWLSEIQKNTTENTAIVLVGNKCDQEGKRMVSFSEADKFASSSGLKYIETSAKDGLRVEEAFSTLCHSCIDIAVKAQRGGTKTVDLKDQRNQGGCPC
eukprot:TRINITY_DN2174_c0_g2_i1.p1 TRINITY_DN2174_c0_g2~~TRINITY_DN2174_c0_g2_i1.p1  ORF type:complete len:202 (-),score=40.49 TRINITY_DN2174_c0_g2_i1:574-1179(-)